MAAEKSFSYRLHLQRCTLSLQSTFGLLFLQQTFHQCFCFLSFFSMHTGLVNVALNAISNGLCNLHSIKKVPFYSLFRLLSSLRNNLCQFVWLFMTIKKTSINFYSNQKLFDINFTMAAHYCIYNHMLPLADFEIITKVH